MASLTIRSCSARLGNLLTAPTGVDQGGSPGPSSQPSLSGLLPDVSACPAEHSRRVVEHAIAAFGRVGCRTRYAERNRPRANPAERHTCASLPDFSWDTVRWTASWSIWSRNSACRASTCKGPANPKQVSATRANFSGLLGRALHRGKPTRDGASCPGLQIQNLNFPPAKWATASANAQAVGGGKHGGAVAA